MDKMSEELINQIEKALDIKFYEWQRKYLLNEPMILDMKITGRGTGKTFIYMIKKLFEDPQPLFLRRRDEIVAIVDWWHWADSEKRAIDHPGLRLYVDELKDIYMKG